MAVLAASDFNGVGVLQDCALYHRAQESEKLEEDARAGGAAAGLAAAPPTR